MKTLKCMHANAHRAQDAVEDFDKRKEEFGLESEEDLVSVAIHPATTDVQIPQPDGPPKQAHYEVSFIFWTNRVD